MIRARARAALVLAAALAIVGIATEGRGDERPGAIRGRVDVEAAQAILAVQGLDGWLLAGGPQNPVASELVHPSGTPTRQWFFFVPARGTPTVLCHRSEAAAFADVPGKKLDYDSYADLKRRIAELVRGARQVAMEYAPRSGIPSLTRVDDGTVDLVRSTGVAIASSAELVQFTKSLWGPEGRVAHYLAMHHLERLIRGALARLERDLAAGRRVTELDLQREIIAGYAMRGLEGPAPVVAAGPHSGDPLYAPTVRTDRAIEAGDVVLIDLAARVVDLERPIYGRLSWVAYVGERVPEPVARAFAAVVDARERTIAFIVERAGRRRPVKGFEADRRARQVLQAAGMLGQVAHRTGHSLDTALYGDGANLDDAGAHDTRNLVIGSGFTVGPGVYHARDFGLRSVTALHLVRGGVERTGPAQREITLVPGPRPATR
jgi:Xaa-Pro dipeptidase